MLFFKNKIGLKQKAQIFAKFAICFVMVLSSLHLDEHNHADNDGYSMCRVDCELCEPHAKHSNCEECVINRSQESFIANITFLSYSHNSSLLFALENQIFNKYSISLFSYSRPPPTS